MIIDAHLHITENDEKIISLLALKREISWGSLPEQIRRIATGFMSWLSVAT